jgi:hypothetical protein
MQPECHVYAWVNKKCPSAAQTTPFSAFQPASARTGQVRLYHILTTSYGGSSRKAHAGARSLLFRHPGSVGRCGADATERNDADHTVNRAPDDQ